MNFGPLFCSCFRLALLMWTSIPAFPPSSSLNLLEDKNKISRRSPVVTWLSPQENDMFRSWDTLTGKWHSQEALDSPAFRLCTPPTQVPFPPSQNETEEAYLDNNCGSKVSPPTVEESDGSFLTSFTIPDVTEDGFFLLQMNDASGTVFSSPIFKLNPHLIHMEVRTRLPPQPNFALQIELQGSPIISTSHRPSRVTGYTIFLIIVCMLLTIAPLLWLYYHRRQVKMYFGRLRASQTSTPALLQKIDPGDGTSVPIPVFMPQRRSRAPSQSMRQLFLPSSLGRASGVHQQPGSSRGFGLPNCYSRDSTYPSLPSIPISSTTFTDEGAVPTNSTLSNTRISRRPLLPPGLVSTPLGAHLRPRSSVDYADHQTTLDVNRDKKQMEG